MKGIDIRNKEISEVLTALNGGKTDLAHTEENIWYSRKPEWAAFAEELKAAVLNEEIRGSILVATDVVRKTLQTMLTSILGSDILCMCQVYLAERRFVVMNREEILSKSKQENHGQDIANLEVSKASMLFGWITAVCLLALVGVVEALVFNRMNSGVFFAVMAGCSAIFINKYLKLRKRHELYIAIVYIFAAIAFFISWILQLTK